MSDKSQAGLTTRAKRALVTSNTNMARAARQRVEIEAADPVGYKIAIMQGQVFTRKSIDESGEITEINEAPTLKMSNEAAEWLGNKILPNLAPVKSAEPQTPGDMAQWVKEMNAEDKAEKEQGE